MKTLYLFLLLASTALAQIDISYTKAKSLVGATNPEIVKNRILIGFDSLPSLSEVAVVRVASTERVRLIVKRLGLDKRETVELEELSVTEPTINNPQTVKRYLLGGEGEYEIIGISPTWDADLSLTIGPTVPPPTPTPPKPPTPPTPVPEPVTSFRVIFVKESGSTLPSEQNAITGAKAVRDYLTSKTTPEGGFAGWREYDPQQNVTNEQKTMKELWFATKSSVTAVPCLIIEVNGKATVVSYPKNVAEALKILKEQGGQ